MLKKSLVIVIPLLLLLLSSGCIDTKTISFTSSVSTPTVSPRETQQTITQTHNDNYSKELQYWKSKYLELERKYNLTKEAYDNLTKLNKELELKIRNLTVQLQIMNQSLQKSVNMTVKFFKEKTYYEKLYKSCSANLTKLNRSYLSCKSQLSQLQNQESTKTYLLIDQEYYHKALILINQANESIYLIMYVAKYDAGDSFDWANDLINALIKAKQRGVDVHVILDNYPNVNEATKEYLAKYGIDVRFDSPSKTTHAKILIIDGKVVLIGSHNWTESALYYNHEVSVLVYSEDFAKELISYFYSIR
ncbi:phospholipase D-like domain-containing protein [Thermococcus barophilus]|uniref:Phospholipase D/Transphosphatidylase n=1 Tax=Thermococcus barophilus (strain DSM 11836 / MP) TaxID=391623 RepID=F0LN88_THEBM|nr:phospholipase D-like domain-containing protein [Thermococcus barophilus]ADT85227.1 phospholipase D/Transphosphatidylase [Thermococcus barophilus MP]